MKPFPKSRIVLVLCGASPKSPIGRTAVMQPGGEITLAKVRNFGRVRAFLPFGRPH